MITFTKVPASKLNLNGTTEGIAKPQSPANIGIPTDEFHKQVIDLANKKIPLERVHNAIEGHPDITEKEKAKSMAGAVYKIMGK